MGGAAAIINKDYQSAIIHDLSAAQVIHHSPFTIYGHSPFTIHYNRLPNTVSTKTSASLGSNCVPAFFLISCTA